MKNLVSILLLAGVLSLPFTGRAQEKEKEKDESKNFAHLFIGGHNFSNSEINKGYGTFLNLGGGFSSDLSKKFRLGGRIETRSMEKDFSDISYQGNFRINQSQKNKFSAIEISAIASYVVPFKGGDYNIGLGATFVNVTEKAEGKADIYEKKYYLGHEYYSGIPTETRKLHGENTETGIGIGLIAGTNIYLSEDARLFFEAHGKFISNELGGISYNLGVSYEL